MKIVIFIIVILILILILIYRNYLKEPFQVIDLYRNIYEDEDIDLIMDERIKFLTPKEGEDVLKKSASYFNNFNEYDLIARKINTRDIIFKHYNENILEFSNEEKIKLMYIIKLIKNKLEDKYKFIFKDINFCKFDNKIENSYPHTHSHTIFLSEDFVDNIMKLKKDDELYMIKIYGGTIIHECIHIWQRKEPKKFLDLYKNFWNFTTYKVPNTDDIIEFTRSNPDGTYPYWIFSLKNTHILLSSQYVKFDVDMGNVKNVGIFLDKNDDGTFKLEEPKREFELRLIDDFINFFEINNNNYHPNELSAELISQYYLHLINIKNIEMTPSNKLMIDWFEKNI